MAASPLLFRDDVILDINRALIIILNGIHQICAYRTHWLGILGNREQNHDPSFKYGKHLILDFVVGAHIFVGLYSVQTECDD